LFNADTFNVASKLWFNSALRDQVATLASGVYNSHPVPTAPPVDGATPVKQFTDAVAALQKTSDTLYKLPIGWGDEARAVWKWQKWNTNWSAWLLAILGWVITGLAASLGAPFWFDLLGKAINMRLAGATPAPSTAAPARPAASTTVVVSQPPASQTAPVTPPAG
jgi:hypothetical protein